MKIATLEELDRVVPVQEVVGEAGKVYRITAICRSCKVEMHLESDEVPNELARAIAAGLMPRMVGGLLCQECCDRIEAEAEVAETAQKVRERVTESNLPQALHNFEFREMVTVEGRAEVIDAVRTWASEENPRGICIFGEVGTGKTRLAATAAWQRLRRWNVKWVSMPILLAQLGAAFNDKARREAISVLTGRGALILDDLDKVNPSEWAKNQLFSALDTRIQAGAPLLITTNEPPSGLGDKFGGPVMSRVAELRVLEFPGQDMRLALNVDEKGK